MFCIYGKIPSSADKIAFIKFTTLSNLIGAGWALLLNDNLPFWVTVKYKYRACFNYSFTNNKVSLIVTVS